jgi:hypothetical protein
LPRFEPHISNASQKHYHLSHRALFFSCVVKGPAAEATEDEEKDDQFFHFSK